MRQPKRFAFSMAVVVVAAATSVLAPGAGTAAADGPDVSTASGPTRVPLSPVARRCDYSGTPTPPSRMGSVHSLISSSGSTATAELYAAQVQRNMHFIVKLIQMPRTALGCGPGDPGTTFGALYTDGLGNGSTTVQAELLPGTTGVWLSVEGPQGPGFYISGEFYTSDFVAKV